MKPVGEIAIPNISGNGNEGSITDIEPVDEDAPEFF